MVRLTKDTNGKEYIYLKFLDWLQILFIGIMNGWQLSKRPNGTFDEKNSEEFCAALEKGFLAIEAELSPPPQGREPITSTHLADVTKRNQLDVIEEFLAFCGSEPFSVYEID
jgi:hypothetical protein